MMHLSLHKTMSLMPRSKELVAVMIIFQFVIACYLLVLDATTSLFLTLVFALPLAIFSFFLLDNKRTHYYIKMAIIMFAVGGFGMMLGCNADLGYAGLLSLLSMCQSTPLSLFFSPEQIWQKIQITPWTYIGMFIGSNVAMFTIKDLRPEFNLIKVGFNCYKAFYLYIICNAGMLVGMLLGEAIAIQFYNDLNQVFAAALMITLMLVGMTLGMIVILIFNDSIIHRMTMAV